MVKGNKGKCKFGDKTKVMSQRENFIKNKSPENANERKADTSQFSLAHIYGYW
jgi:hypothetical protein